VAVFVRVAWRNLVQCHLRAQRSRIFNRGLLLYPTQTEISLDFLNLMKILWMEDDERHKCFAILHWEMWNFNGLKILSRNLWWTMMTSSLLKNTALLHPNMIPQTVTNSAAHCGLLQNRWIIFWGVLQPSKSKSVHIYKIELCWWVKRKHFFVSLSANTMLNRMNTSQILYFYCILQNVPTFSEKSCNIIHMNICQILFGKYSVSIKLQYYSEFSYLLVIYNNNIFIIY